MGHSTSISLGNHFENFIEHTINDCRFSNVSEVVRAGLWLLNEAEDKVVVLRNVINEELANGRVVDFAPKKYLAVLKAIDLIN